MRYLELEKKKENTPEFFIQSLHYLTFPFLRSVPPFVGEHSWETELGAAKLLLVANSVKMAHPGEPTHICDVTQPRQKEPAGFLTLPGSVRTFSLG